MGGVTPAAPLSGGEYDLSKWLEKAAKEDDTRREKLLQFSGPNKLTQRFVSDQFSSFKHQLAFGQYMRRHYKNPEQLMSVMIKNEVHDYIEALEHSHDNSAIGWARKMSYGR